LSTANPLDNVIWNALTTRQAEFAEGVDQARRFMPEVTALGAFREPTAEGYESLARLLREHGTVAVFLDNPYEPRAGWKWVAGAAALQMICENGPVELASRTCNDTKMIELGAADSAAMLELTALTKPGPFGRRTHELGTYLGFRRNGKLVAMAGERMKVPGYTEVSAVCTHPEHTGQGYAGILMAEVMRGIRERGEIPILHVRGDNLRAIALYERLGFSTRHRGYFALLRKESVAHVVSS